jgi:hypothetical protein
MELDPAFSQQRITSGPMAVLGVASIVSLPEGESVDLFDLRMRDVLYQTLRDKRRDVRFLSAGEASEVVGDDAVSGAMAEFRTDGRFRAATMSDVAESMGDRALHVVAARIQRDEITGEASEEAATKDGKSKVTGHKYTTKRTMEIAYEVYDLTAGKAVAQAVVEGTLQKERTIAVSEDGGDAEFLDKVGKVVTILDEIFGDEDSKYPDPPTSDALVREITGKLAKELPGGE